MGRQDGQFPCCHLAVVGADLVLRVDGRHDQFTAGVHGNRRDDAGGPLGTTTTMAYYLYQQAFQDFRMGQASAVAVLLFVMLLVLTLLNSASSTGRCTYQ